MGRRAIYFPVLFVTLLLACGEDSKPDDSEPIHDDTAPVPVDEDEDGYPADEDCDDSDPDIHPGADEHCDGLDEDCDGDVDEDAVDRESWYVDSDGDGWGDPDSETLVCEQPSDTVAEGGDCDDGDPELHPGARELCWDDIDNDCDGEVDEHCTVPEDYPLEGADAVLYGVDADDNAGFAVASAGDVNADGYADVVIGAPNAAWWGDELGDSYEVGDSSGAAMIVLGPISADLQLDQTDARVQGASRDYGHSNIDAGWSVAGVGDTNGDGFDDVLIGDPNYFWHDVHSNDRNGMAGLFLGPISGLLDLWGADAIFDDGGYYVKLGYDVASGGDLNGDGLNDVLVGVPYANYEALGGGGVRIMTGPMSGNLSAADATAYLYSDSEYDLAGSVVSGAGDFDGDGLDDILVGAPGDSQVYERGGAAYLVLSHAEGVQAIAEAEVVLFGESEHEKLGWALASAGDLDDDGYGDIVLGSHLASELAEDSGAAYIFYGRSWYGEASVSNLDDADAVLSGAEDGDKAGRAVDGAGDVDGDGHSDLIIGQSSSSGTDDSAGTTWLVHGPIEGTYSLDEAASVVFSGTNAGDQAGTALAWAGDVDADGLDDILIGAPGESTNGSDAGAAYLILGAGL